MVKTHMATITIGDAGPNAGAVLTVPICMDDRTAFDLISTARRKEIQTAIIGELKHATHAPFFSPEFRGPVGDVAVAVALRLLTEDDLSEANIASVDIGT
jgi:hypothetical protein